jgi:hypothetical protein
MVRVDRDNDSRIYFRAYTMNLNAVILIRISLRLGYFLVNNFFEKQFFCCKNMEVNINTPVNKIVKRSAVGK